MAKTILKFQFDFLNPSLRLIRMIRLDLQWRGRLYSYMWMDGMGLGWMDGMGLGWMDGMGLGWMDGMVFIGRS